MGIGCKRLRSEVCQRFILVTGSRAIMLEPRKYVISLKDDATKCHAAHVVEKKGDAGSTAVAQVLKDIDVFFNHEGQEIILKSDQENSMIEVLRKVKEKRTAASQLEHSPVEEHESNGVAERAVQMHEGMTRTMKLALEERLKVKIPSIHPIMTWLVQHGADTLTKFVVGSDGRTGYERAKGKTYKGECVEFGSCVFHRIPGDPVGGSMEPRWELGIWIGKTRKNDEHVISNREGNIVKTRDIRVMPEEESWKAERLSWVRGTTWDPNPTQKGEEERNKIEVIPYENAGIEPQERLIDIEPVPRDFIIHHDILRRFGFSSTCPKCISIRAGTRNHKGHNQACRARIREALQQSPSDVRRLQEADERAQNYFSRQLEKGDNLHVYSREASEDGKRRREEGKTSDELPDTREKDEEEETLKKKRRPDVIEPNGVPLTAGDVQVPTTENSIVDALRGAGEDSGRERGKRRDGKDENGVEEGSSGKKKRKTQGEVLNQLIENVKINSDKIIKSRWLEDWWKIHSPEECLKRCRREKPLVIAACIDQTSKEQQAAITKVALEQWQHGRKVILEGNVRDSYWNHGEGGRLIQKKGMQMNIQNVSVYLGKHGKFRIVTNEPMLNDKSKNEPFKHKGDIKQETLRKWIKGGLELSMLTSNKAKEEHEDGLHVKDCFDYSMFGKYIDDVTGKELDAKEVRSGRLVELAKFAEMKVYEYVDAEIAKADKCGKIVGVRWVDIHKNGLAKCRLVAQEFAGKDDRDDIFAATPPLVATKFLLSDARSRGAHENRKCKIMILDVKSAFLYGIIKENIYIYIYICRMRIQ